MTAGDEDAPAVSEQPASLRRGAGSTGRICEKDLMIGKSAFGDLRAFHRKRTEKLLKQEPEKFTGV